MKSSISSRLPPFLEAVRHPVLADHLDADDGQLVLVRKGEAVGQLGHAARRVGLGRDELAEEAGGGEGGEVAEV